MKVSEYISKFISDNLRVSDVFVVSGIGNLGLLDSISKNPKLRIVCNHHEQASALCAYSYSRISKNIGVAIVTTGPGGTNAITGVGSAWTDSIPMLVLTGQVNVKDTIGYKRDNHRSDFYSELKLRQNGVQEVDIVSIVKPITKYAVTVTDKNKIKYHLQKAAFLAREGRQGPVLLDVPMDIQSAEVNEEELVSFSPFQEDEFDCGDISESIPKLDQLLELIKKSERPVIIAGYGIQASFSECLFENLLSYLKLPVLVTWKAISLLPENHELYIGRFGVYGQRGANLVVQNSDLVISIGSRLSIPQIGYDQKDFARNAKKVIIDIDRNEIRKFDKSFDLEINCDAQKAIAYLFDKLYKSKTIESRPDWLAKCKNWQQKYPVCLPEYKNTKGMVNSFYLVDRVSELLKEGDIIIPGASGTAFTCVHQAFKVKNGQTIYTSNGFAEMGFDLPGAIGAAIWSKRQVILFTGDGSLQMNLQELQTIKHYNLPIKIFYFDNSGYLTIRHTQSNVFDGRFVASNEETGVTIPDIEKLAELYEFGYFEVDNSKDVDNTVKQVLEWQRPTICRVFMDKNQPLTPKLAYRQLKDGTKVSCSLEDMSPFLSREELKSEMIAPLTENSLKE